MPIFNKDNCGFIQKKDKELDYFYEVVSKNKSLSKQNFYLKVLVLMFFVFVIIRMLFLWISHYCCLM